MTRSPGSSRSFTLIEVLAVVLLLGLAAAGVGARWASLLGGLERRSAMAGAMALDRLARTRATSGAEKIDVLIEVGGTMSVEAGGASLGLAAHLPREWSVSAVRAGATWIRTGSVRLGVSSSGVTATYSIQLVSSSGGAVCVVVSGITGQAKEVHGEEDADRFFDLCRAARPLALGGVVRAGHSRDRARVFGWGAEQGAAGPDGVAAAPPGDRGAGHAGPNGNTMETGRIAGRERGNSGRRRGDALDVRNSEGAVG